MTFFVAREERVDIPGPCGNLEAVAMAAVAGELSGQSLVAVVCHPHPLHGGTMNNKVVTSLCRVYRDLGVPVVRFNFRGVGSSDGVYDNAVGEVADLLAVIEWLRQALPGRQLLLAGFSFGSSVAAQAVFSCLDAAHLVLVAPPVDRYAYDRQGSFPVPVCVVQGTADELMEAQDVSVWCDGLDSAVCYLPFEGACHFFHGQLTAVKRRVSEQLVQVLI